MVELVSLDLDDFLVPPDRSPSPTARFDFDEDHIASLWAAAELHTPDPAEQAIIVALCVYTGRTPAWLVAAADARTEGRFSVGLDATAIYGPRRPA